MSVCFFHSHTTKIGENWISSSATLFPFLCALTFFMYFSPEVLKSEPYGEKADVWAAGCILYQMATLSPPFCSTNMLSLATKVGSGEQKGPLKLTATPCSSQNPVTYAAIRQKQALFGFLYQPVSSLSSKQLSHYTYTPLCHKKLWK